MDGLNRRPLALWIGALILILARSGFEPARAEVPDELEPDYSEAVLAYNAKDYSRTQILLAELMRKAPKVTEFLELQALALKSQKKPAESVAVYEKLIRAKMQAGTPQKELASYHFELGVIRFGLKDYARARANLNIAARHEMNVGPTHLYLGMDAFQRGAWGEAEKHFEEVLSSNTRELWAASAFYLAQAQSKEGYAGGAAYNLGKAKAFAKVVLDDEEGNPDARKVARQIYDSASQALAPFDKTTYFAQVGTLFGLDTNPQTAPLVGGTGIMTGKWTVFGGVGLATSPLGFMQFVPSFRFSGNLNTSSGAEGAEFLNPAISLLLNRTPLARFSWGFKLDGAFSIRNNGSPTTTRILYTPFSMMVSTGAFIRYEVADKLVLGFESGFEPQWFFIDSESSPATNRTGYGIPFRAYIQNEAGRRFFNPRAGLKVYYNATSGTDFRYMQGGVEASNTFHLLSILDVGLGVEGSVWNYPDRTVSTRTDILFMAMSNAVLKVTKKFSILANLDFTLNSASGSGGDTTVASTFSYVRFNIASGVSYSF